MSPRTLDTHPLQERASLKETNAGVARQPIFLAMLTVWAHEASLQRRRTARASMQQQAGGAVDSTTPKLFDNVPQHFEVSTTAPNLMLG